MFDADFVMIPQNERERKKQVRCVCIRGRGGVRADVVFS